MAKISVLIDAILQAHEAFSAGADSHVVFESLLESLQTFTESRGALWADTAGDHGDWALQVTSNVAWSENFFNREPAANERFYFFRNAGNLTGAVALIDPKNPLSLEDEALFVRSAGVLQKAASDRMDGRQKVNKLKMDEELLRLALDSTTEGFWGKDFVKNETYASESWLANFGWSSDDFPDRNVLRDLLHPDDNEQFETLLQEHLDGHTLKFEMEYRVRCKDGSYRYVLGRAKVVSRDNNGKAQKIIGAVVDLSDFKKIQSKLLDTQKTLVEAAKFSALGVMAAGIAHEINNPLAIIQAYSEVLSQTDKLNPQKIAKARSSITKSVERITAIVRGLRKVARDGENDPFETVSMQSVFDEIMGFSRERILSRGIAIQFDGEFDLAVSCQPVQLSQVILNLLNNSIDALQNCPEKIITIETRLENSHRVVVRFSDSGPGISEDIQAKIFEPFFTTKRVGEGTGLGLSISRSIIEDHGGKFYLDRSSQKTCFVIDLPLAIQQKNFEAA